ncbi:MAG: AAA family ATPase [Verrucomicrobiales bacterium]|nr:AAA family ATPase [Verrucomicrobiales bacterium]MCP5558910.1 AAA family ATPase [Verrucomicrobiaceae bacterium]
MKNGEKSGVYDPLEDEDRRPGRPGAAVEDAPVKRKFLEFFKPSELAAYVVPKDVLVIGDMHIFMGGIFVLGGAAGVGKSFALSALAVSGATGEDWFGLKVHRKFKTMILQAENGLARLSSEYRIHCEVPDLDDWVLVSRDVDVFAFDDPDFREEFKAHVEAFKPDVIVLDPWNRATKDVFEKDFRAAFEHILSCLPPGDKRPALVICAHTKKPREHKAQGRGLLNELSGSLVLGSIPRAAYILQAASDDPEGKEFVFSCCKNNNGEMGRPTAWRREGVRFVGPVEEFDWEAFKQGESGAAGKNTKIEESHMEDVFGGGHKWLKKDAAAKALMKLTGAGRSAAYNALDMVKGRFCERLRVNPANGEMSIHRGEE